MDNKVCACGTELQEGWGYCPMCGMSISKSILVWHCPKCESIFEHDGTSHPHGILCPECRANTEGIVGVLQERYVILEDEK